MAGVTVLQHLGVWKRASRHSYGVEVVATCCTPCGPYVESHDEKKVSQEGEAEEAELATSGGTEIIIAEESIVEV